MQSLRVLRRCGMACRAILACECASVYPTFQPVWQLLCPDRRNTRRESPTFCIESFSRLTVYRETKHEGFLQDSVSVVVLFQKGNDQFGQAAVQGEEIVVAHMPAVLEDVNLEQWMGGQGGDVARRDYRVIGSR